MRKAFTHLVCLFFCLVTLLQANAQVYSGNLTLNTQAAVDAFNYTEVTGNLTISGAAITNLNGLSELTKAGGIRISNNGFLTSIIGLANLADVDGLFVIEDNFRLTNIDGLSSLTTIGDAITGGLIIENNNALLDIDGLFSLTFARGFTIKDNPSLTNLDGLSALNGVGFGDIIIDNNDAITDLDGLSGLQNTVNGNIKIINNQNLTNVDGLDDIETVNDDVEIRNNASLTSINMSDLNYLILGTLNISNNPSLTNLNGLTNINDVGNLFIGFNDALTNINGLSILSNVRGGITINTNNSLLNIDGLSGLDHVNYSLSILNNPALTDIDGLENFTAIGDNLRINNNDALTNLDGLEKLDYLGENIEITGNASLTDFCGLAKLLGPNGDFDGTINITGNGANTVSITAPPDIILNNDAGQCSKDISAVVPYVATVTGCLYPQPPSRSGHNLNNIYPVGTTNIIWSATDGAGNTATALQQIIISDNESPVITTFPADATVSCAADVPAVNTAAVTATDNCPNVTISHVGDVITNQTCVNRFTLTRTYKATDNVGNTATRSQVITVYDNVAPVIGGLSVSKQMLAPPNHKMQNIEVNYSVTDNCVASPTYTFDVSSNEPVNGTGDGDTDPDWIIDDDHNIRLRAERAATGNGRIYTITVTADDGCNPVVTATKTVTVAHNITGPHSGNTLRMGSSVALSGEFWDIPGNRHTAKWLIDGSSVKGTVTEPSGNKNGKVTGSYKFNTPGVYKLQMNVTDQKGVTTYANTNGDLEAIVVIYDPKGGNTYGGGYFNSPAGAFTADPSLTGKVSYGFAMNYFKNSTFPKGETQFEFKIGDFEFNALNFDYLVIGGTMAQFKGTGKITGGQSGISFIMSVIDGELDGTGTDKVRIKIFNKNTGQVYYDNQPGASEADLPVTPVGGNSTVVINNSQVNTITSAPVEEQPDIALHPFRVMAYPNPGNSQFTLRVNSADFSNKVHMQVSDVLGRIVESKTIAANENIIFGQMYKSGIYYLKIIQGENQRQLKLIKLHD